MNKVVNALNNRYLIALMVALFLWGIVRTVRA